MNPLYSIVAQRARHRCEYCHAPEVIFNFPFEVEHILPVVHQGPDDDSNLVLACRGCNLHKAGHLTGQDEATGADVPLFHPRHDRWDEHFSVNEQGIICGQTPRGRATVAQLRMNSELQVQARTLWVRLGIFP